MHSQLFELNFKEGQALEDASSMLMSRSLEQRIILNWIFSRARKLQSGQLRQKTGIASMTLLGNKGIGKTVCLQLAGGQGGATVHWKWRDGQFGEASEHFGESEAGE